MLWVFSDSVFDDSFTHIIVQAEEDAVFEKIKTENTIYYIVTHDTYEKWAMWYGMAAEKVVGPSSDGAHYDYERVLYFTKKLHTQLSKLKCVVKA